MFTMAKKQLKSETTKLFGEKVDFYTLTNAQTHHLYFSIHVRSLQPSYASFLLSAIDV